MKTKNDHKVKKIVIILKNSIKLKIKPYLIKK